MSGSNSNQQCVKKKDHELRSSQHREIVKALLGEMVRDWDARLRKESRQIVSPPAFMTLLAVCFAVSQRRSRFQSESPCSYKIPNFVFHFAFLVNFVIFSSDSLYYTYVGTLQQEVIFSLKLRLLTCCFIQIICMHSTINNIRM